MTDRTKERLATVGAGMLCLAIGALLMWAHTDPVYPCDKLQALDEQQRQVDAKLIADLKRNEELRAAQAERRMERELKTVQVSIANLEKQVKEAVVERVEAEPIADITTLATTLTLVEQEAKQEAKLWGGMISKDWLKAAMLKTLQRVW